MRLANPASAFAGSSSSGSSKHLQRCLHPSLLPLKKPLIIINQRCRLRSPPATAAAASSDQPPQQPGGGPLEPQQSIQQQQVEQVEQQLEQQQQPLSARAAEVDFTAALQVQQQSSSQLSLEEEEEETDPELERQQQEWLQQDLQWRRTARNVYFLMALGLTAGGLLVAVAAGPLAAAGLKLGVGLQAPQAAVLLGCFGATVLRAASLAWFLAEGAALGELGSWRYQRVNLGMAAAAAAATVAALTAGWAGAQPWLLLLLVGGCGATAAACVGLALGQLRHDRFYFASAVGYGDIFQGVAVSWWYLVFNVTCLAGALMTGMAVLSAVLGLAALTGSALLPVLPWLPPGSSGVAAATLLHKLLGAGLLLLALQAWTLTEYAANGRDISLETGVKLMYARTAEDYAVATGQLGPAPVHVPLQRFDLLHAGFVAAAVAQGLWLAQAAAAGPGLGLLNAGDPLWGSLFWAVMGCGLYLLILLTRMDFADIKASLLRVLDWAGALVSLGAGALFVDWMWLAPIERR